MEFVPPQKLVLISSRVPPEIREKAVALAKVKGVSVALIYRSIIVDFFSIESTQNVDVSPTNCGKEVQSA